VFDPEPGELDPGLYYYKARFYDPAIGRFLQTDPAGTQDDLNLYAYVGNNPVNRVDPTGLAKVVVGDATVIAQRGMPLTGAPGSFYVNPGNGNVRYYDENGNASADLHFNHLHDGLSPHGHNWGEGFDRNEGLAISPLR